MSEFLDFHIKKIQKEEDDYINNSSEQHKQDYWDRKFCGNWWHSDDDFPINLTEFRKKIASLEQNFDRFIPWIMLALEDLGFTWDISDIFILDEQSKKYLEIHWNLTNNSQAIWNVIDWDNVKKNKTSKVEWVDLSSEELAERIWDLFYDSLASFLLSLWEELSKWDENLKKAWEYLKIASNHIMNAWRICLPYVWEWFPNLKHSTEIKWLNISREELIGSLWNLTNEALKEFLLNLSKKIHKDWLADEWRWRKKLSNELFETAKSLELAWNLL